MADINSIENLEFQEISGLPITEDATNMMAVGYDDITGKPTKVIPLGNFATKAEVLSGLASRATTGQLNTAASQINQSIVGLSNQVASKANQSDVDALIDSTKNMQAGILFQDRSVATPNLLPIPPATFPDGKIALDLWGVFVESEGCYYQYSDAVKEWNKTIFKEMPADVATKDELFNLDVSPNVDKVLNGTIIPLSDASRFTGYSNINIAEDWIEFHRNIAGNSYLASNDFLVKEYIPLHVKFRVEISGDSSGFRVILVEDKSDPNTWHIVGRYSDNGEYDFVINPADYGYKKVCIFLSNNSITSGQTVTARYYGLTVSQIANKSDTKIISGSNSKELFESVDKNIIDVKATVDNLAVDNVSNGTPIQYCNVGDFANYTDRNIEEDWLEYIKSGTGNKILKSPMFIPTGRNEVNIEFTLEITGNHNGMRLLIVGDPNVSATWINIKSLSNNGTYNIRFDAAYYTVYHDFTQFYVWFANNSMSEEQSLTAIFRGLKVYEVDKSITASNISGSNSKELFESVDKELTTIKSSITETDDIKISPIGNRFEIAVMDNGSIISVPVIPNKSAFFVNSLGLGFETYGMAASAIDKDYYFKINNYITALNLNYTPIRVKANSFEGLIDASLIDSTIQSVFLNNLSGNEDLVVIQLGDNVNNQDKLEVFKISALRLCKAIRNKCPNARVFWMGMWYSSTERYSIIQEACSLSGCKFISLSGIRTTETENEIGNISRIGSRERTLNNVISVIENSINNISVVFTVGNKTYTSQSFDIDSFSLENGVLTYTGEYEIISEGGVASHPNDIGNTYIANAFLYESKISNNKMAVTSDTLPRI